MFEQLTGGAQNKCARKEEKLFYAQCITANRYLFSYGRKPKGKKLKSIKIPDLSHDDIKKVVNYINSLPYSVNI